LAPRLEILYCGVSHVADNQRTARRYSVDLDVEYTISAERKPGKAKNISLGGLYIAGAESLSLGQKVGLKFQVPTQKEAIEVGAQVRWIDKGGFGVQFDGLRARDVWALGKYFEKLSQ
jgi:hypothetical protein